MTTKLATTALALLASAEKIKLEYWYGLTGDLGAVVAETCNRFNASQDLYEAVCVGHDGHDTELLFNTTLYVKYMEDVQRWINEGYAAIRTTASGKTARDSFVEGECSIFFSSIADHNTIHKLTPAHAWDVQIIPTFVGVERTNSVVGGASLWVLSGKTDDEYRAAATHLAFHDSKEEQQFLLENSGYIPVTKSTYDALLAEGFFAKEPFINRDIAMKPLTWTEPGPLTRGIRLGGMIQIRAEWLAEVEAGLADQKTMQEALDTIMFVHAWNQYLWPRLVVTDRVNYEVVVVQQFDLVPD